MWKKIFACFLCCLLVAIPFVQRSYAAVTTITVVSILILTLLSAMGITLVVADGTKEAFIADKGDSFMSSKGYSGSFADWISGGTPMDISLKLGTLMVAKAVVDRVKEFINWLVPGASSGAVIDLSSGSPVINPVLNVTNNLAIQATVGAVAQGLSISTVQSYGSFPFSVTDANNTLTISNYRSFSTLGYYDATDTFISASSSGTVGGSSSLILFLVDQLTQVDNFIIYPGVYLSCSEWLFKGVYRFNAPSLNNPSQPFKYLSLDNSLVDNLTDVDASAIIGDYDDLSDLTTTTTEGSGGTTIINNTFYITQDGQALNPSGQTLDDIIDALRKALESDKREVTVTGTTAATVAAGEAAPNYSDFQLGNLDLSGLGALLTTRFPFSIPWDLVRIFEVFVADPEAPHWSVNLLPIAAFDGVDTTLDLDLGDYPIIGQVSRWFCIIDLCLGLVFATKKLIWTA